MKALETTKEVIDALGGTSAVAKITGRTYNAAHNWRSFEKFPANTFVVMSRALRAKGLSAPAELWGMVEVAE